MKLESTAIIILGMHRSGTSCLAGSLQQRGLYLGKVFEWSPHNLKGNRESEDIMHINDAVLVNSGNSWDNPPTKIAWNREHIEKRDKIIDVFTSSGKKIWGFKDPRTLFTLPFWQDGIYNIRYVGTFRHPLLVAKSLNSRNKISIKDGLELWNKYNMKLLSYINKYNFPLTSFDVSLREYQNSLLYIIEYLGIDSKPDITNKHFFEESLRNHISHDSDEKIPEEVTELYDNLNRIYQEQYTSYKNYDT